MCPPASRIEPGAKLGRKAGTGQLAIVELPCEADEACQVGLADELALSELRGERRKQPGLLGVTGRGSKRPSTAHARAAATTGARPPLEQG